MLLRYETYSDSDANLYFIEPNNQRGTTGADTSAVPLAVLVTVWPSFTTGNITHTLYDGATGDVMWHHSSKDGDISWFQCVKQHDDAG